MNGDLLSMSESSKELIDFIGLAFKVSLNLRMQIVRDLVGWPLAVNLVFSRTSTLKLIADFSGFLLTLLLGRVVLISASYSLNSLIASSILS